MTAEKIKLLLFSDTHIGFDHPANNKPSKNRRRGPDFLKSFRFVIDQAVKWKVDYLIHCGDVFEKPHIPEFLVDQTYMEFLKAAEAGIRVLIVPGNHERSILPSSLFLNHPNICLFVRPETFQFNNLTISGFPYFKGDIRSHFRNIRTQLESNINEDYLNILCVHHAIDGAKAGSQYFEFKNRPDTLNINDLPGRFDLIFSGHIHKYQKLDSLNDRGKCVPIIYSGSTERTMFDEIDEVKGFHTFDIQGKRFNHRFHSLDTPPMKRIDLKACRMNELELETYLQETLEVMRPETILQLIADDKTTLFRLSQLKTRGFFPPSMHITVSGFSKIHRPD